MPAGHLELSDGDIKKLGYQVRCDLLNYGYPVLVAKHFQYKVEKVFSKEFILNCLFGKTKYYAIHFAFQERPTYTIIHMNVLCTKY